MPISYKFFPEFELLMMKFAGLVTGEELLENYAAAYRDELLVPGTDELAVLTEVSTVDVDLESLTKLSELTMEARGGAKNRTAAVSERRMDQIMVDLYGSVADMTGQETVRAFDNLSEALRWLDRPELPPEKLKGAL